MTKLEQAAAQLLEAIEDFQGYRQDIDTAIADLRDALDVAHKPAAVELESAWIANDWSVFNTGAEVASGLSLDEAMDYLTDERAAREWSVVCVINKDNMPTPTAPQPTRQPLTDEQVWKSEEIMAVNAAVGLVMDDLMMLVRAVERAQESYNA